MDFLGEGPFVPLHPNSTAGTLSSGGLPPPPDPSEDPCGYAVPFPFPSNKPQDSPPECPVGFDSSLGSRVGSRKSPSPSRKNKGSGIPRRYLIDLEVVLLNIEAQHEEGRLDDGFGIYEILNDEDPVDEEDGEIEDATKMYASGMRRFDEPTSTVDEPTKERIYSLIVLVLAELGSFVVQRFEYYVLRCNKSGHMKAECPEAKKDKYKNHKKEFHKKKNKAMVATWLDEDQSTDSNEESSSSEGNEICFMAGSSEEQVDMSFELFTIEDWQEAYGTKARVDEGLLFSSRLESRKKVPPFFSHTVENVLATYVATRRKHPIGVSRQPSYRDGETRCNLNKCPLLSPFPSTEVEGRRPEETGGTGSEGTGGFGSVGAEVIGSEGMEGRVEDLEGGKTIEPYFISFLLTVLLKTALTSLLTALSAYLIAAKIAQKAAPSEVAAAAAVQHLTLSLPQTPQLVVLQASLVVALTGWAATLEEQEVLGSCPCPVGIPIGGVDPSSAELPLP
ncbi:hypothetical protein Taro_002914 [Colocasia esculenta]|uniref:CCHC-type domain-containing protein n=1 Tax=Colocasia esculenta TaxID=4460 RepID=A0A843TE44_COLES|nr:hypothetical protein [Colocasia esculenta]